MCERSLKRVGNSGLCHNKQRRSISVTRLYYDDQEKAKRLYSQYQCLQAEDIAEAVVYALSAPKHVDVNEIIIRPTRQGL